MTKGIPGCIIFMLQLEHIDSIRGERHNVRNENLSEKVSVNVNTSTLSEIDLLIDSGYYSNRSDFINQALREGLQKHRNTLDRIIQKNSEVRNGSFDHCFLGVLRLERQDIEAALRSGQEMTVVGYGVLIIGDEMDEKAFFAAVRSIQVKGRVICSKNIKEHYRLK